MKEVKRKKPVGRPKTDKVYERRVIYLEPKVNRELEQRAASLDMSVNKLTQQLIKRYLSRV